MVASEWRGSPVYKHPCQSERRESWRVFHRDQVGQVIAEFYGELLVIDSQQLSPEVEVAQDLMTIVHCFSSRLCGLRSYHKALKEALK